MKQNAVYRVPLQVAKAGSYEQDCDLCAAREHADVNLNVSHNGQVGKSISTLSPNLHRA